MDKKYRYINKTLFRKEKLLHWRYSDAVKARLHTEQAPHFDIDDAITKYLSEEQYFRQIKNLLEAEIVQINVAFSYDSQ